MLILRIFSKCTNGLIDFLIQKFNEYEKDWREKNPITATLQSELKSASMKVEDLEKIRKDNHSTPGEVIF